MWKKVANRFYFWQESNLKKFKKKKAKISQVHVTYWLPQVACDYSLGNL